VGYLLQVALEENPIFSEQVMKKLNSKKQRINQGLK